MYPAPPARRRSGRRPSRRCSPSDSGRMGRSPATGSRRSTPLRPAASRPASGERGAGPPAVGFAVAPGSDVGVSLKAPENLPMGVRPPPATTFPPRFSATGSFYVVTLGRLAPRARCAPAARPRRSAVRGGAAAAGIAAPLGDLLRLLLSLRNPALDLWPRGIHDALRLIKHRLHLAADLVEALRKVRAHVASGLGCVEQRDGAADDHPVHHASQISHRVLPCGGSPDPTRRFGLRISRVAPILPSRREILIVAISEYARPSLRERRASAPEPPGRGQPEPAPHSHSRSCRGILPGSGRAGRAPPRRDRQSGWRRCTTTRPARRRAPATTR